MFEAGREILFKAQRVDTKEWVEGYIARVHNRNKKGEIESYFFNALDELGWSYECVVSAETVCQYTGLNDGTKWEELSEEEKEKFLSERNHKEDRMNAKEDWSGRKIFEGDICKDGDNVVRILWSDKHQWGVEISKTDSVLSKGLVFPLWQYDDCEENGHRTLEVIGNIFDNPELLNQ